MEHVTAVVTVDPPRDATAALRGVGRPAAPVLSAASTLTAPVETERPETGQAPGEAAQPDTPWVTVVHNDPVNLMSYVTYVFQTYFGYPKEKAKKLMLDVHHKGRAVVSSGSREEMERDVQAMHGYGLWATLQRDA